MYANNRAVVIDGIRIPDPAAIEQQRRREQPAERPYIQPTVEDIDRGNYERWQEEQRRKKDEQGEETGRGVFIIDIGGGEED